MPRMFDILKNNGEGKPEKKQKESLPKTKEESSILAFPRAIFEESAKQEREAKDYSLVSKKLISAVKTHGIDDQQRSSQTFGSALEAINILLKDINYRENPCLRLDKIYALLDDIFNQLVLGDSILENIYKKEAAEYWLPYHIAKVTVLSTVIGMNMGFNKSALSHLGMAAVFCDVGLDPLKEIAGQAKKLSEEEHNLIKTHISKSLEAVRQIAGVNELVKETIRMHHERANGKGYPHFMNSGDISLYAKILGLADTFAAITNDRPYRQGMSAHQAVKFIIGPLRDYFDPDLIKVFINKLSIYPIGSIVRLDTQESAKVIGVHAGSPLRPIVMLIQGVSGEPVKEKIIIDLSKQDTPSIQEPG